MPTKKYAAGLAAAMLLGAVTPAYAAEPIKAATFPAGAVTDQAAGASAAVSQPASPTPAKRPSIRRSAANAPPSSRSSMSASRTITSCRTSATRASCTPPAAAAAPGA
ncbi:hypothetical protein LJK87_44045 [Paenibacillus sp. P25]|nr:hypothetical protein LJK87_44045 [Paenibacillus sp. P25]